MGTLRSSDGEVVFQREGVGEVRRVESGDLTVAFGRVDGPFDPTPLFQGLPDDMCQCRHQGYVIRGRFSFKTKNGLVHIDEGEAFDIPPGHIPLPQPGCEWVLFSDAAEQRKTNEAIRRNAAASASATTS